MNNEILWVVLSTMGMVVGLLITYWIHSRHHMQVVVPPLPAPPPDQAEKISVIVPARDEARNIRRCVEALFAQTYPNFEILAVDDRSTDATPQILADLASGRGRRLRVIHGADLPAGWAGKPHALVQGVAAARGDWLCFIDADTFAGPDLLSSSYALAHQQGADLFSVLTYQELGSFWEKVILPLVFTALSFGFPAGRVNDPRQPDAIANGQFILMRRSVYEATGGHASVRGRVDEDKALAELVKGAGYRLVIADGRPVARTRMYNSLREIWEGWTKNIFLGLRDRLWLLLFGAVMGLLGALLLPAWLFGSLAWLASRGGWAPVLVASEAALLWAYLLIVRSQAARAFNISPWYAFSLPLGALVFTSMMLVSAFRVISGKGVQWKGRVYSG